MCDVIKVVNIIIVFFANF